MANPPQNCRWAFLGLSAIAVKFLKDLLLARADEAQLTHSLTCVGTTGGEARARAWLAEQRVPGAGEVRVYTSYAELLLHGDFDVVYISTPLGLHFGNARDALRAGRHVLLEKPAVVAAAQWRALGDEARRAGVVLMEAMWTRYQPAVRAFEETVRPQLGAVRRIVADFSLPVLGDPALPRESRFQDWRTGAGSLYDLGVYPLAWVDMALGPPDAASPGTPLARVVHAHTQPHQGPHGPVDDVTTLVLRRDDPPCTAIVTTSLSLPGSAVPPHDARLVVPKNAPAVRVQGALAEAAVPFPPIRCDVVRLEHYAPPRVGADGFELHDEVRRPLHGWGLRYQADVIAHAVLAGEKGLVIGEHSTHRILSWLDQARDLAQIRLPPGLELIDL
ncbi:hypothetical protein SLS56_012254 [Neofusicoccum ribis]|uniref:D-xylose 1-dehydrogenase (NADP(+), D-xylono-1,5-lactone-forming) n=1 Tax=Neofusicoccum ribis TaxID=45134 RepID=A0ABR3S9X5_9PEZI